MADTGGLWAVLRPVRLGSNPLESLGGDETDNEQIPDAKARGGLPFISVLVRALEADVINGTLFSVLTPDTGADGTIADFMRWLVGGRAGSCLRFHVVWFGFGIDNQRVRTGANWHRRR